MTGILKLIGIFAVIFVSPVSGVQLTFTRNRVIMGSPGEIVMTCAVDESDIRDIFLLQVSIYSKTFPTGKTIALLTKTGLDDTTTANLGDLANRVRIEGSIATNLRDSRITVTFDTEKLQCSDAAYYECTISYLNNAAKPLPVTRAVNTSLEVYEYPVMGRLVVKHNGIEVNEGTSSRNPTFKVGDQIELACSANVGSINTTLIQWRRTTEIGRDNIWNEYQPSAAASEDGQAVRENCGYLRTATMFYNMTIADANRQNDLGFECYVRVSDPIYNNYMTPESTNPKFYADVSGGNGGNSQTVASAGSGQAGAIAGGVVGGLVLIVIIVLLVYFLWYRRRGTGEDYKTKEDTTEANRAPPIDNYSTVDKSKKYGKGGHANDALDEPHETRKPRDRDGERGRERNGPGKANYGMDRDDDDDDDYHSRDGSPTMGGPRGISHMGMDPVDGSIEKPGRHETRRKGVE